MSRRALVSQTRMPEVDRDRGSGRVDQLIRFLLDAGWSVTFLAEEAQPDQRHARRLRRLGVSTHAGYDQAAEIIEAGDFDLALLAFWRQSETLLPLLRRHSPRTRIIIESIDLHFLREARRSFGLLGRLDDRYGTELVRELNTYRQADAVLAVSAKETALLGDFIGEDRVHEVTLSEAAEPCHRPFAERSGMLFVGNFRHLPNGEAVEFLCRDVVPRIAPELLAAHPLTVVGSALDARIRSHAAGLPGVRMVGWVPSVVPYVEQARVSVVPLLHGAGIKGKVVEALQRGTPVVTTPIGAEGLGLTDGHDAFVATDAAGLADAITRLLVDEALWNAMRERAWHTIGARSDAEDARAQFLAVVDHVLDPATMLTGLDAAFGRGRERMDAYVATVCAATAAAAAVSAPGEIMAVVSRGDDALLDVPGRTAWHFPRDERGEWAGHHPADSDEAVAWLEQVLAGGARYLVLPAGQFWWLEHYDGFAGHLARHAVQVHADADVIVFDLVPGAFHGVASDVVADRMRSAEPAPERVLVLGTYSAAASGPPASLVDALETRSRHTVVQRWRPRAAGIVAGVARAAAVQDEAAFDWVVEIDSSARLPQGFLDRLLAVQAAVGAERAQPAHRNGPAAAAPVSEQLRGCVARVLPARLELPVFSRRAGAARDGTVLLVDAVPIGLDPGCCGPDPQAPLPGSRPGATAEAGAAEAAVLDVIVAGPAGPVAAVQRSARAVGGGRPRLSVVIATYRRPDLLDGCLGSFAAQQAAPGSFEVVVVDDGTPEDANGPILARHAEQLPLTWVRIDHGGRSTAKNLAIELARGDVVLLFDDDDRAAPDLIERHLAAHEAESDEALAVLGHTDWAPELAVTPLMHFLTDVDKLLFAYGNLTDGQLLDWRGFWEGRLSVKRSLLLRRGLHDQRLAYSIDVELAWRLAPAGLAVRYVAAARSVMARSVDLEQFCARIEAKGRAAARFAQLHDTPEIRAYTRIDRADAEWAESARALPVWKARLAELESSGDRQADAALHQLYRRVFAAHYAKGVVEGLGGTAVRIGPGGGVAAEAGGVPQGLSGAAAPTGPVAPTVQTAARRAEPLSTPEPMAITDPPRLIQRAEPADRPDDPELTVTIPVWSRNEELADMAVETVERLRAVARLRTEIVVVDNGSPHQRALRADVYGYPDNRGVSVAWNAGVLLARAGVVAVLNSDCRVEPGWDEALVEAACDGRRIAFPYTDHGDGLGFRRPDQAGTAGWCFVLRRSLFDEIGPFDERFSPAFCEDTDYWHRAWELGVELSPVPAARVSHARRTTGRTDPHVDLLLQAHRFKYGWKHGVDPLAAPPYYSRPVADYIGAASRR